MALSYRKKVLHDMSMMSLVGKDVEIAESKNKNQVGLKGRILHESANFFIILSNGQEKRILKSNAVFKVFYEEKALYMDGRFLLGTLQSRIKKFR